MPRNTCVGPRPRPHSRAQNGWGASGRRGGKFSTSSLCPPRAPTQGPNNLEGKRKMARCVSYSWSSYSPHLMPERTPKGRKAEGRADCPVLLVYVPASTPMQGGKPRRRQAGGVGICCLLLASVAAPATAPERKPREMQAEGGQGCSLCYSCLPPPPPSCVGAKNMGESERWSG